MFYTYYTDTLVTLMLGWIRGLTDWIWKLISMGDGSGGRIFLAWFSSNWLKLVLVMIAIGVALDWIVWLIRWRPYWLWFGKKRRILDDTRPSVNPAYATGRTDAPRFSGTALGRKESPAMDGFPQDELFDVVSPAIGQSKAPAQHSALVGPSIHQYIDGRTRINPQKTKEKPKTNDIEWFE